MSRSAEREAGQDGADLFGSVPEGSAQAPRQCGGPPRLHVPRRDQIELRACDLEALLAPEHRARLVWGYVQCQDLSILLDAVKARGAAPGRRAIDPCILFALWLYATLEGVGSGREIARRTQEHDAYRWICGGVSVNYHALNDFRSSNEALMDQLLSDNIAALAASGAITLQRVAQDGIRVRASAGTSSLRRKGRLHKCQAQAQELVQTLKEQARTDPGYASRQQQAAQLRAAHERERRIAAALARLPELEAAKKRKGRKPEQARASTTDADATVMKMADGGFRPAYNVQYAADCDSLVIVGVDATTNGTDMMQLAPMVQQVMQRTGQAPAQWLVDGGFPAHAQIDAVAQHTELYAPVPLAGKAKDDDDDGAGPAAGGQFEPKPDDSKAVAQWRTRMGSEAARQIYKLRAATIECVNAQARNRGLQRLPVRGLGKVRCVATLFALAHNLMRMVQLAPELVGLGRNPSGMRLASA